jgi:2-polyprenyl-6-methoxyphenol hydroxylase-like FAD-dependent oxidoreductase
LQGRVNDTTVLVLGAGVPGLCAAYELERAGYLCEVLEARSTTARHPDGRGACPGDRASRLFELYDSASLAEATPPALSDQEITQFEITGDGPQPHVVVIEGPLESGRVVAISAGSLCQSS